MSSCLDEQQLRDLADGRAPEALTTAWMAHVEACEECGRTFKEWAENLKLLHELRGTEESTSSKLWRALAQDSISLGRVSLLPSLDSAADSQPQQETAIPDQARTGLPEVKDFRIVRELHSGGQGIVYEAVQLSTRRTVALKLLLDGPGASRRSQQRFEREIELIASLKHPNIVTIHDSGITRGQYYYAMDYVRGEPLDTHVRVSQLDVRSIMRLFKTVCEAMAHAHQRGVIHRDLKPSNILVDADGVPYVLDFGLARILGETDHPMLTLPGVIMGTVPYMSPEQTSGRPQEMDTRTDVYTLGVILYELLVGFAPYAATGNDLAKAFENIRTTDPSRPSKWNRQVNTEIDAIVQKAMEKDPGRRYGSAGEMAADITAWLEGRPVQARSASSLYVLRKLVVKHSFESLVVFAMILGLGGLGAVALDQFWQAHKERIARQGSEQFAAQRDRLASIAIERAAPSAEGMSLGWFLLEWHQDRLDQAGRIQRSIRNPDYAAAMAFLLSETTTLDQLQQKLSPAFQPLAYFVAAERELKAGHQKTAASFYQRSLETPGNLDQRSFVEGRLKQLRPRTRTSGPTSVSAP